MEDSKLVPPSRLSSSPEEEGKVCAEASVGDMSLEKAKKLIYKTSTLHEKLFRRLAE